VSGGTLLRPAHLECKRKILIDTDPGWNHFVNYPRWDAQPSWDGGLGYRAHDHFFTYAERLGAPDCRIPDMGLTWHPTRPPVVLDCWQPEEPGETWTTVMTWKNFQRRIEYEGVTYGTKELEFPPLEPLPASLPGCRFELAVGGGDAPRDHWRSLGWNVVDSHDVSRDADAYRRYVQHSRGEFSVAKNVYTATRSGWFSCRSTCYLAAGRPVVTQDTGFSQVLPTGRGLMAFSNLDEAAAAVAEVEAAPARHADAARDIARAHFDSNRVLGDLLETVGLR
jgi:hypothetical protein